MIEYHVWLWGDDIPTVKVFLSFLPSSKIPYQFGTTKLCETQMIEDGSRQFVWSHGEPHVAKT